MSTNRKKDKTTTARHKAATLAQKLQGNELVSDVGIPQNTMNLVPNVQTSAISMIPNDKTTANPRKGATIAQMPQGNGLVFDVGVLRNTTNLEQRFERLLSLQFSITRIPCSEFALSNSTMWSVMC